MCLEPLINGPPIRCSACPQIERSTMTLREIVLRSRFIVLLGKNGSGKSTHLRALDERHDLKTVYITPERGGELKYNPNLEHNIESDPRFLTNERRQNRTSQFRTGSAVQFRQLELLVLREIQNNPALRSQADYTFDATLTQINSLLLNVELRSASRGFSVQSKGGEPLDESFLSSGEVELIALAIEVLVFARTVGKDGILLMDEPDVHLHPDLQQRFVAFIESTAKKFDFRVVMATHSTAIIAGFADKSGVLIVPIMSKEQALFEGFGVSDIAQTILPIFGAHPLSSQFNDCPPLLVEGEDDRRVIDQLVRSSNGAHRYSLAVVGTVTQMSAWEAWLDKYLPALYDRPRAYSLRDLDESGSSDIDDLNYVRRARLNCYEMENLILCDESLKLCGVTPDQLLDEIKKWRDERPSHPASKRLEELAANFDSRRTRKIKEVRNVLVALLGIEKPWEVHIGQMLAKSFAASSAEHSLANYLGSTVREKILNLPAS